jgi:outer membrane receptor for ferrienterochelin and colicins
MGLAMDIKVRKRKRLGSITALLFFFSSTLALAGGQSPAGAGGDDTKSFEDMFGKGTQEEDAFRNDRLLVTATGSQKPLHLAPSVASVITAEDIKDIGATTLDEALETVPGVHVEPSGSRYFTSIWSIRGIHTSLNPEVLLLINGVPFTDNYQGSRYFTYQMPVAMISRIEVVRGPGSALYGADAFAGVVNVITKDNFEINGTQAGVRYGSFDTVDTWAQQGGQYGGWDLALGAEWRKTRGDNGRVIDKDALYAIGQGAKSNAPAPLDTRHELLDTHLNLRKQEWTLHLYGTLQESSLGPGGAQAVTYGNDDDTKSLLADLSYHNAHQFADWELNGRLYYSNITVDSILQYYPPAYLNMRGEPMNTMEDGGLEVSGLYKGFVNHQFQLGAGFKNYNFEPDQYRNFGPGVANQFGEMVHITNPALLYMPSANRQLGYLLAQDEWQLARHWTLTGGLRYDDYSDFGSTVNPRAALVWETRYDLTTKLMYGQAFRAPSFNDLYTKNNPVAIGNPDNGPEKIKTYELAFDYQPIYDLHLLLNLFTYDAKDLIEVIDNQYTNSGEQDGKGFEIGMDWQALKTVRLRGNFAYQRSENVQTDAVVTDAPGMEAYLNPSWAFKPDWSLNGQFTWVADRHRAEGDPRDDIKDYELIDLILRKKNIAKHWEAALSVRNLFDEDARIPSPYSPDASNGALIPDDYPMAGRSVWGEVSCHL